MQHTTHVNKLCTGCYRCPDDGPAEMTRCSFKSNDAETMQLTAMIVDSFNTLLDTLTRDKEARAHLVQDRQLTNRLLEDMFKEDKEVKQQEAVSRCKAVKGSKKTKTTKRTRRTKLHNSVTTKKNSLRTGFEPVRDKSQQISSLSP